MSGDDVAGIVSSLWNLIGWDALSIFLTFWPGKPSDPGKPRLPGAPLKKLNIKYYCKEQTCKAVTAIITLDM